ncbi:aminotransferase class IV [Alphaproteobacteria bacterium]|nr:aminotransferase class IV [Alphaproteobacteria bacterium]
MSDIFPKGIAWIDNEFVDISKAKIPILDWGFLRSDATYDVVHVWNERFFLLDNHVDRFFNSTKKLRMPCVVSREKLKKILAGCVKKSNLKNAYVEMIQTRGVSNSFNRDPRQARPRFMAFAVPFGWILKPNKHKEGLDVVVTPIRRIPPNSIDPTVKNYHWLDFVSGMFEAYDHGHQTCILVDQKNNILEGPGFNVFSINNNTLSTPKTGVLEGVTRGAVIKIAQKLKMSVKFKSISFNNFLSSSEIFITSTAGGVMPVTKVNNKKINKGLFGKKTKLIYDIYWEKHKDPDWSCSLNDIIKN